MNDTVQPAETIEIVYIGRRVGVKGKTLFVFTPIINGLEVDDSKILGFSKLKSIYSIGNTYSVERVDEFQFRIASAKRLGFFDNKGLIERWRFADASVTAAIQAKKIQSDTEKIHTIDDALKPIYDLMLRTDEAGKTALIGLVTRRLLRALVRR